GLGETGSGAAASRVALTTLVHLVLHYGRWNVRVDPHAAAEILDRLEWGYGRLHDLVTRASSPIPALSGMATTLTAADSAGDQLFVPHGGPSRAYLVRDGLLRQLTRDQTPAEPFVTDRRRAASASHTEDLRHILTDVIGGRRGAPRVQLARLHVLDGDCL